MQSLCMKRASLVQDQGLFKAAKAWQVLSTLAWPRSFDLEVYSTLPTVGMVDIFISHSWSCPSWMKFLAMCQYLNLDFAIKASGLTCSLAITLLVFRAGGLSAVSQASQGWLYGSVVCGPIAVFLGTYFLGHTWRHESFWFDRVCVNQAELGEKARTLQGIPAFVAHSQHMLVILDSSYFERLWCNYEVAVAAKTAKMVHLVPVWEPVCALGVLALGLVFALSYFGTEIEPRLHGDERTTLVWSMLMYYYLDWFQCFIVAIPLAYFCLEKLTRHKLMLDQMAAFELRCASCSLNSDREVIEQQIIDLFDEAFEPPVSVFFETIHEDGGSNHAGENKETLAPEEETLYPLVSRETMQVIRHVTSYPTPDEVMEQFNGYIRGSLREKVLGLLGREVDVSLKLCLVSCMPGFLLSLTFFLGCNGHQDCEASASALGYPSLPQYMLINALMDIIVSPTYVIILLPLALRIAYQVAGFSCWATSFWLRMLSLSSLTGTLIFAMNIFFGLWAGSFVVVIVNYSFSYLLWFLASSCTLFSSVWLLHADRARGVERARPVGFHVEGSRAAGAW